GWPHRGARRAHPVAAGVRDATGPGWSNPPPTARFRGVREKILCLPVFLSRRISAPVGRPWRGRTVEGAAELSSRGRLGATAWRGLGKGGEFWLERGPGRPPRRGAGEVGGGGCQRGPHQGYRLHAVTAEI